MAAILFLLIATTDRNQPMFKKCGRISAAIVVLFLNMIVDIGAASDFASLLQLDHLFFVAREILYALGLSGTALISMQVYALSIVAMFTLLYLDCKASLALKKDTHVVESVSAKNHFYENKSNQIGFFNYSCISAKRLN